MHERISARLPDFIGHSGYLLVEVGAYNNAAKRAPVGVRLIPNVGELSRKERDDLRLLYPQKLQTQKIKVLDDFKRLEKSFPEDMAKVRAAAGATVAP